MQPHKTVGIAAIEQADWPPYGKQRFFFEDMVTACQDLAIVFFFFSPKDALLSNQIEGWVFVDGSWKRQLSTLPRIIYDRAFSAESEERKLLYDFRQWLKKEQYQVLNPVDLALMLDDKVAFHHYLHQNKIPTLEVLDFESLNNELIFNTNPCYFIKPISGSGGLGIYVVKKSDSIWTLKDHLNEDCTPFDNLKELYTHLSSILNPKKYFIQPKANIQNFEDAPIDLRVLIQNHGAGKFQISGMVLRQGQQFSNVSNLQSGGTALAFEELNGWIEEVLHFSSNSYLEKVKKISFDCCQQIERRYGEFAEIGLDFLLTTEGPILMEGNARPSRWVFNVLADRFSDNPEKEAFFKNLRKESVRMPGVYALSLFEQEK
jgi:hypothetical protein